jgi:hypothetical protein
MIRALLILIGSLCLAQESIHYASLSGRVSDPTGASVEGARITVRETETNLTSATTTDREGRFRFSYLKPGRYEVKASQPGFADALRTLTLTVGSAFELPLLLAMASAEESITVSGEGALLEAARTQIAGTISQIEARGLPLNGRNFLDLALLVPGVSPANTSSNQLFAETSAVPGQGISVGGQRNFSNNFIVDGLSANDDAAGLSGVLYGLDVVDQFQVVTSGGQAEFGRALGGYMNVITKSGTNSLHGDFYGYLRNQRLNSSNPLLHATLPLTQAQYGASLGGPVLRDRTFFFANFEQRILNQSGLITIAPSDVASINARLASAGYRGPLIATGLYSNPVHSANFLGKLDHQFSSKDQFAARYSLYDVGSRHSRGAGALNAASASAGLDNRYQTVAASNVVTLSSRLVNETRGQFTRGNLQAPPADPVGPAVTISGVATLGRISGAPTGRVNDLYEIANNLSFQAGAHALRTGVDFLHNDDTITYPRAAGGSYAFSSLANFLGGVYNNSGFTQTFGNPTVSQGNPNLGLFAQDEWKLGSRLTLNLGLRYELQYLQTIATDTNNFSPRAGFAWSPFKSRRTVVRGSYGLFYDRVPLRALANALLSAKNTTDLSKLSQISVSLSPAQAGAPVFPNILSAAGPSMTLPNLTTMDPRMQNAYSQQGSFEIEQQVGSQGALSAGYQYLRGIRLIASINQNVPACVASGSNNGCRPDPNYANNGQYSPRADSNYNGLHISFVQRPARWGSYRVSYTYSKALDNVGEFFFSSPIDPYNIWRDYGRSDDDQRHRLVFNGTVHTSMAAAKNVREWLVNGFQLSGMLQYYSSLPLNIASGTTTIQGTAARPVANGDFIGRNVGQGLDFFNLNVRLSRSFHLSERLRLDGIAEMFNALNHTNGVTLNGTFGPGAYPGSPLATFRQITAVAEPRSIQLALRLTF